MRLGDLDTLKEYAKNILVGESTNTVLGLNLYKILEEIIDNAPTVVEDYDTGYQDGLEDGLNDIRPQGEWIVQPHSMIMKCSLCGNEENAKDIGTINPDKHFCSFCGAEMRGIEK